VIVLAALAAVAAGLMVGRRMLEVPAVDLARAERSVFSPAGQDGILEAVFRIIEPTHRYLVDLGAGDGVTGSSSRNLILNQGWRGLLVESESEAGATLGESFTGRPGVQTLQAGIFPGDIELILERAGVPRDLDLLVVGIASNDWYVWRAIRSFRPKVVQIEYNAAFVPPQTMVIEYHPYNYWDGSLYFGASIQSLYNLGQRKGYELVHADRSGTTLYFVDRPYFRRFALRDNRPRKLYVPRADFPLITPGDVHQLVHPDGRPRDRSATDLVRRGVRVERYFVVGER